MKKWSAAENWRYRPGVSGVRPSISELPLFERIIKSRWKEGTKALILGATGELRDLCFIYSLEPTIVDYKRENVEIQGEQRRHPRTTDERIVEGNWTEMGDLLKGERFLFIMGDLSLNMLNLEDQQKVLEILEKLVKKEGVIILRHWARRKDRRTLNEICRLSAKPKGVTWEQRRITIFRLLTMDLINHFCDENGRSDMQDIVKELKKQAEKHAIPEEVARAYEELWGDYEISNYLPTKNEFEHMLEKAKLRIVEIMYGNDEYKHYCPIYVLVRS
jgi:hypothetical protein